MNRSGGDVHRQEVVRVWDGRYVGNLCTFLSNLL